SPGPPEIGFAVFTIEIDGWRMSTECDASFDVWRPSLSCPSTCAVFSSGSVSVDSTTWSQVYTQASPACRIWSLFVSPLWYTGAELHFGSVTTMLDSGSSVPFVTVIVY